MGDLQVIGKRVPLTDAVEKVTGKAIYAADVMLPGMLRGKILRSPHAHARILNIDTSAVERLPGVFAVATARNTPANQFGPVIADENFFAVDEVHYIGDEVAAVAAVDEETAEEALSLIKVEYEVLPAVFDPIEAMREDAPLVHRELGTNIRHHIELVRGDVDEGFANAVVVIEETFRVQHQYQAYIEPNAATAIWEGDRLTLYAPIQTPRTLANAIYMGFKLPKGSFRFIQTYIGGGFGGKAYQRICPITAALAKVANRPVQIVFSREEDMVGGLPRVAMVITLRMGADASGRITAKEARIIADNGAYTAMGQTILDTAATRVDSLYRFKNVRVMGDLVYTHKIATGMFRGFGNPQAHFPVECMMDMLAEKLGMDAKEIRLRNATQAGDVTVHGWKIDSCGLSETIEKAAQAIEWEKKRGKGRPKAHGVGLASGLHVSGNRAITPAGDGSAAQVRVFEDGSVLIHSSEGDIGQGAKTVFAQIAAEVLCVPYELVRVAQLDTDVTYFGVGAGASRVTTLGGNAVKAGAAAARERLIESAADAWECDKEAITLMDGKLLNLRTEEEMPIGEAATHYIGMTGGSRLMGEGFYRAEGVVVPDKTKYGNISIAYAFGTHAAEVEVDLETGQIHVLKLVGAHDSGRVINPMAIEGQIEGGLAMGMWYAIGEELVFKDGRILNNNFTDYRVPTALDVADMNVVMVETIDPHGPFGAKSVGEMAMVPTAAAIANAVYDAIGIWMTELPMSPERVLKALKERQQHEAARS